MEAIDVTEKLNQITPQWLAGFFDGEGCVNAFIGQRVSTIRVSLTQKEPSIIFAISMLYPGGDISKGVNKLKNKERFTNSYRLTYCGLSSLKFLETIKNHVICKRKQVHLALEFLKYVSSPGVNLNSEDKKIRLEIMDKISKINQNNLESIPLTGEVQ